MKYTYTDCDICGVPGPEEEKTTLRYKIDDEDDERVYFGLCPYCFEKWRKNPDDGEIVSE